MDMGKPLFKASDGDCIGFGSSQARLDGLEIINFSGGLPWKN
jgi:hypothetical protein